MEHYESEVAITEDLTKDVDFTDDENVKERFGNQIILMAPTRQEHNDVIQEIAYSLKTKLKCSKCKISVETVAIRLDEYNHHLCGPRKYVCPDVMVRCKRDNNEFNNIPELVIEVLSLSTKDNDLGCKKELYEFLGVKDYLIVSQDGVILHYSLIDGKYQVNPNVITKDLTFVSKGIPNLKLSYDDFYGDLLND